jgi:lysine-specific demethylase 3
LYQFLNKVSIEKGHKLETHNDPIHDQSAYVDGNLRKPLFEEYGVVCYAYPHCEGDTICIPAGAPHQVTNIHSCIKVAEDFVSPENLEWCFFQIVTWVFLLAMLSGSICVTNT